MTEAREDDLLAKVTTLASLAELHAFRDQIKAQAEVMGARLYAALMQRSDRLAKQEGRL
jgi:hypothetical protein